MRYRIRFSRSRKGRRSSSTKLRRVSSTKVKAIRTQGRSVVLSARPRPATAPPDPRAAKLGLRDRFTFEAVVRREDPTTVWNVTERRSGRAYTLQTHELAGASDWQQWDGFVDACAIVRSLQHPALARYVEHDREGAVAYMLTQRVPGRSLADRIEHKERFSDVKLRHLMRQALQALAYLHELHPPVFHADIHPACLFVADDGRLTVTAFEHATSGLAFDEPGVRHVRHGYTVLDEGTDGPDAAADVFSLGATLAAVACGRDALRLPRKAGTLDLSRCMRAGPLRDDLERLIDPDPLVRLAAAALGGDFS